MSKARLKDQQIYTRDLEKDLSWFLWGALVSAIIFVVSFIWGHTFIGDLKFGSGGIFVIFVATYINTTRRLRRLRAANARNEYILDKEFKIATYDKDGNEID